MSSIGATTQSLLTMSGLQSGLNTASIIQQLMQVNQVPQAQLQTQQKSAQSQLSAYQVLNSMMQSIGSSAANLALPTTWQAATATSSNTAVATASAGAGAISGNLTFSVNQLATSASAVSTGTVSSTAGNIITGNLLLSAAGGLGFSGLAGSTGLTLGAHTLTVTQGTTGATVAGSTPALGSTTITAGSNDAMTYSVDGVTKTLTLPPGTYTPAQLALAVQAASGGNLDATIDGGGHVVLDSVAQGSAHTLTVTGGSALAALGITPGASGTGTNGAVSLDGGPSVTVSDASAGAQLTLTSGTGGTVTATLGGGLTAGSSTLQNVSSGTGSLADVVNAINQAGAGVTAAAVQVAANQYRLQLNSTTTGAGSAVTLGANSFAGSALGTLQTLTAGQDAKITVGTGPGAYQVDSGTNSVSGVMPGVTLNLLGTTATNAPVTVTTTTDAATLGGLVSNLVQNINSVITQSNSSTAFDSTGTNTGVLLGDQTAQQIPANLQQAVTAAVSATGLQDASAIGITVNSDGTLAFDQAKFTSALQANPSAVQALFINGTGTTATGIAQRLQNASKAASDPVNGYLTSAIQGSQKEITDLGNQISAMQVILDQQQQQLQAEFTNMETAMAQLQSQGTAMAGALGQATTSSSTSSSSSTSKGTLSSTNVSG